MRTRSVSRSAPDVSVVVPVYNKEQHLEECVASVLDQQGVTLELVCVDDRSTDGSWDILRRIRRSDQRVKLVRQPANMGSAIARNTGIDQATGRYLQFTDADDLLAPGALAALHEAAVATRAEIVRGLLQKMSNGICELWSGEVAGEVRPESRLLPELQRIGTVRVGSLLDLPELWIPWFHTCFLVSRQLVSTRGIRYPALAQGEDPVFLAQALTAADKLCVIPAPVYIYRIWAHQRRAGFEVVRDYFAHAEMVKYLYGRRFSRCWEAYGPYIHFDLDRLVANTALDDQEARWAQARLERFSKNGPALSTCADTQAKTALSVIIPCRNAERHLGRQLEALARQETRFSWEAVFVDNGSTDRSVSIAKSYSDRMQLRIVPALDRPNQAYARRVGAEAARADRLVFIDADDELAPGYLDAMYAALAEHDFVTSPVDTAALNAAWAQYAHAVPDSTDGGGSYIPPLANGCTVGIARALLEAIGGPPEDYDSVWDLALSVRAHLAGVSLAGLPSPLVRYRLRDSIVGLFRQTRAWGSYQARAHREFGPRVMPRRTSRVVLREWTAAVRKLLTARTKGDVAQSAVRFGYCVGRLQGSLRYRTLYL